MTMFALPNVAILAHRAAHAAWIVMGAVVVGLPDTLYTWQQRHRMRRELLGLDEDYADIEDEDFDSSVEVRFEQSVPFPADI